MFIKNTLLSPAYWFPDIDMPFDFFSDIPESPRISSGA